MSNSKSQDTPLECSKCSFKWRKFGEGDGDCPNCKLEPPQDTSLDEQLMEVMLYVRTTHEVEHNDNQWTREFVFSFDEAKAKINRLIVEARIDAYADCGSKGGGGTEVRTYAKSRAYELTKELGDSNG